jgi:hypothetical protein
MKRFHHFAQAVLGKVSLGLLSRAFCGLLLIAGIVAPGAAQSIFATNTAGIEPAQVSKFSPTGTVVNYAFLTFYNESVPAVAYSGGVCVRRRERHGQQVQRKHGSPGLDLCLRGYGFRCGGCG